MNQSQLETIISTLDGTLHAITMAIEVGKLQCPYPRFHEILDARHALLRSNGSYAPLPNCVHVYLRLEKEATAIASAKQEADIPFISPKKGVC